MWTLLLFFFFSKYNDVRAQTRTPSNWQGTTPFYTWKLHIFIAMYYFYHLYWRQLWSGYMCLYRYTWDCWPEDKLKWCSSKAPSLSSFFLRLSGQQIPEICLLLPVLRLQTPPHLTFSSFWVWESLPIALADLEIARQTTLNRRALPASASASAVQMSPCPHLTFIMWILGIKLRSSWLQDNYFTNHLFSLSETNSKGRFKTRYGD